MHTAWLTAAGLSQARRPTRTDGHSPIGLRCFQRCFLHASYSLDARYSSSLSTSMSNQSSFFSVLLASRLGWCSHTGRLMPDAFRLPQQQRINAYSQIVRRTQRTVTQTYSVQSCETYTATSRLHDRQACGQTDRQTEQSMNSASLSRCRDSNIDFSSAALLILTDVMQPTRFTDQPPVHWFLLLLLLLPVMWLDLNMMRCYAP